MKARPRDPSISPLAWKDGQTDKRGHQPLMHTEDVARMFGINHSTLLQALREVGAPQPTLVTAKLRGAKARQFLWGKDDQNRLALWWLRREKRLADTVDARLLGIRVGDEAIFPIANGTSANVYRNKASIAKREGRGAWKTRTLPDGNLWVMRTA